jgi:hypothetical protein
MYPKISPRRHKSIIAHENEVHHVEEGAAISEVAIYGAFLADSNRRSVGTYFNVYKNMPGVVRISDKNDGAVRFSDKFIYNNGFP